MSDKVKTYVAVASVAECPDEGKGYLVLKKDYDQGLSEARAEGERVGLRRAAAWELWRAKKSVELAKQYGDDLRDQDNDVTQMVLQDMDAVIEFRRMAREVKP